MHPVLFEFGSYTLYSYGFCIAMGALLAFAYGAWQAKKQFGLTLDQSNNIFLWMLAGGILGGKLFIVFEDPSFYYFHPKNLLSGSGFVFYGSLLTCIPLLIWILRKYKVPLWPMMDVIAIVVCIVHGFGRIGCFMAGCCYGISTESLWGVVFTDAACLAEPLNTPLHPTQLYEAGLIFSILFFLLRLKNKKQFDGQLFLIYLMVYAAGRGILELFRGDLDRGFVIQGFISNSQLISLIILAVALFFYGKRRKTKLVSNKPANHGK